MEKQAAADRARKDAKPKRAKIPDRPGFMYSKAEPKTEVRFTGFVTRQQFLGERQDFGEGAFGKVITPQYAEYQISTRNQKFELPEPSNLSELIDEKDYDNDAKYEDAADKDINFREQRKFGRTAYDTKARQRKIGKGIIKKGDVQEYRSNIGQSGYYASPSYPHATQYTKGKKIERRSDLMKASHIKANPKGHALDQAADSEKASEE